MADRSVAMTRAGRREGATTVLFAASTFSSAFLLFLVQPMIAKMGVPLFGGSPAVWTTCLVFFQVLLLGAYAYAHAVARRLSRRALTRVHLFVLIAPIAVLAPTMPASTAPSPAGSPIAALAQALALSVALPFFALATNGTLAQRWYAVHSGREPYFLYAASNSGSLLALLAYPLLLEPNLDLTAQARVFSIGYFVFVALATATMLLSTRPRNGSKVTTAGAARPPEASVAPAGAARGAGEGGPIGWTLRAAVPSILLIGVTLRISIEVGAVPLIWIAPLALYLLSFVLAFTPRLQRIPRWSIALPAALLVVILLGQVDYFSEAGLWSMTLPLAVLFLGSWLCHADLARARPAPERLTSFYLWIAVGGALGSALTNLVAPVVFTSVAEYPLALVLLTGALVVPERVTVANVVTALRSRAFLVRVALVAGLALAWLRYTIGLFGPPAAITIGPQALRETLETAVPHLATILMATALVAGALRSRRLSAELLISVALVAAFTPSVHHWGGHVIHSTRSFYGTLHVVDADRWRLFVHGTIIHGGELRTAPGEPDAPASFYYYPGSPMAWAAEHTPDGPLAVVGLGPGTFARLIRPEHQLTFYEIDPMVESVARQYFTNLARSKGEVRVEIGDARLRLEQTNERYHTIVVAAFSSDAIPAHLVTEEALRLYLDRLLPDGVVYMLVTNRYLDLLPVIRSHVKELGVHGFLRRDAPNKIEGAYRTDVVALTASPRARDELLEGGWTPLDVARYRVRWTDARSSLLPILRPKRLPH